MSYSATAWTVMIAAALAAITTIIVQGRVEIDLRRRHHDVGSVVFLQLGVVFAVLLAFVFSEAWGEYNEAAVAINLEVSAMHGIADRGDIAAGGCGFDPVDGAGLSRKCSKQEWPIMSQRRAEQIETDQKLEDLVKKVASLRLSDFGE